MTGCLDVRRAGAVLRRGRPVQSEWSPIYTIRVMYVKLCRDPFMAEVVVMLG